ncbi:MAG: T9SS C-terminal target domain-containing protein [Haliscomenobacteraceae bacterium CHB4]|nr:hypothetical protein [Saprospiraceae bacterium]MCE7925663.1 T9SS C-terminal target domain-containing protein [Haliscomenobacteraceae bacterium CHB4]
MKRIFFACTIFSSLFVQSYAQWMEVTPDSAHFLGISVVSSHSAFTIGYDSYPLLTLYHTTDGGVNWEKSDVPTFGYPGLSPDGIQFLNEEVGYIWGHWLYGGGSYAGGGHSPWVIKTTDGGNSWIDLSPPVNGSIALIHKIYFFNEEEGVMIWSKYAQTTDDGGLSWQMRDTFSTYHVRGVGFSSDGRGVVLTNFVDNNQYVPGEILTTNDYGKTWLLAGVPGVGPDWVNIRQNVYYNNEYYIDENIGFRSRWMHPPTSFDYIHTLDKTTNGGLTWEAQPVTWNGSHVHEFEEKDGSVWMATWRLIFRSGDLSSTKNEQISSPEILITPNPISKGSDLRIKMSDDFSGQVEIRIFHANGLLAQQTTTEVLAGTSTLLPVNLPPGIYFITIKPENQRLLTVGKLVVY